MEPVRDRPTAILPDSKRIKSGGALIEYSLFQKTLENLKSVEALSNLVVKWPTNKFVTINVPLNFYYSTCFKTPRNTGSDKFVYFYDGNFIDEKKIILGVRAHIHSKTGEILHLKKSDAMKGTDALVLGISLLKKLKIQRIFLNDASSFEFAPGVSFLMRVYVPIISADGRSWYGKYELYPLLCRNLEGARNLEAETEEERKAPIYNQDPNFHKEAVHFIRNMPVSVLIDEVISNPKEKEEIRLIAAQHSAITIHELALGAFNEADKTHFIRFNQIALKKPKVGEKGSHNKVRYSIALDCLYSTKILVLGDSEPLMAVPDFDEMTGALPGKVVSYDTFINS